MTLLYPWALALAALVAVPLILHLRRNETRQRVAFPAIRYLRTARRDSARALRLRDRLLMLVRVGIVAILGIAAAVPLVGRGSTADHWPTDVVMLIDNTASMNRLSGDGTLLNAQMERARLVVEHAVAGDRFWILPAVGEVVVSAETATGAAAGLGRVAATDGSANLGSKVTEALRLLPGDAGRTREIHVLSDFQQSAMPDSLPALPEGVSLLMSRAGDATPNAAVTGISVDPPGPAGGGGLTASLDMSGGGVADTVEARLTIDGETVAIARTPNRGDVVFRFPTLEAGEHGAAVAIPPSGLRVDDQRSFVLRSVEPPVLAHVGPQQGFISRGLEVLESSGQIVVRQSPRDVDAIVVEGAAGLELARAGIGPVLVLVPPIEPVRITRFNDLLARNRVPWRMEVEEATGDLRLGPNGTVRGLEGTVVRHRYLLDRLAPGTDSTLLSTTDGRPWLVSGRSGLGPYLLLASPLEPAATDLPIEAAMVPFLEALLFRWGGLGGSAPPAAIAGRPTNLPAHADSLEGPGGQTIRVDGSVPHVPLRAGIHTVHGDGRASLLAVNAPVSESNLAQLPPDRTARRLGAETAPTASSADTWKDAIFAARRGRSAVPLLVLVVVALALGEILLASPGERGARRMSTSKPGGSG